ncbi:uncharacterized protein LOC141802024 isoform X2 [Halichoeres trimaculatus]|uniref:uncharacterized protein LOC141802024 isoform X2 n=1 Tax=Halichoeres trimaculatus TaxID=147232 RepID=UPI003D9DF30A
MVFKWIQMLLFLTALLHFVAAEIKTLYHTARVGDNAILSCGNVIKNQHNCDQTTWTFRHTGSPEEKLVTHGQISTRAEPNTLSVTENCSLLLKKITWYNVGHYSCQQYPPGGKPGEPSANAYLSLLSMSEQKRGDEVIVRCSLLIHEHHTLSVKWLHEGKDVDRQARTVSQCLCHSDVTFQTNQLIYQSRNNSLQCEVTEENNKQLFPLRLQPSGGDGDERKSTPRAELPKTTTPGSAENRATAETMLTSELSEASDARDCRCCSGLDFFMLALRVSELVLVSLLTVLLFRAGGNQRPPGEIKVRYNRRDDTVHYENVE